MRRGLRLLLMALVCALLGGVYVLLGSTVAPAEAPAPESTDAPGYFMLYEDSVAALKSITVQPKGSQRYTAVSDIAACTKILVPGAVRIFRYHGHCRTGAARTFLFIFKSPLHAEMFFTETVPPSYRSGFRLRKTSPHIPSLHFLLRESHRGADRM